MDEQDRDETKGRDKQPKPTAADTEGQTGSAAAEPEPRSFEEKGGPNAGGYHVDDFSRNDAEGATALDDEVTRPALLDEAGRPMREGDSSVEATPDADERNAGDGKDQPPA